MKVQTPNLEFEFENFLKFLNRTYHYHKLGKIISIDFIKATARVELLHKFKQQTTGTICDYSPLIHCPIFLNYNKTGGILKPIEAGDECMVFFNDVSIDEWYSQNGMATISKQTDRTHHIHDGIVLPGLFNPNNINIKTDYNNDSMRIWFQDTIIQLKDKIKFQNATISLKTILTETENNITNAVNNNNSALNAIKNAIFQDSGKTITTTMNDASKASIDAIIAQNATLLTQITTTLQKINLLLE